jgi:hypothetical protein
MDIITTDESEFQKEVSQEAVMEVTKRILKMTDEQYYKDCERVTNSDLTELKKSPKHLRLKLDQKLGQEPEEEDKKHNIEGKATHCAILEADQFEKRFFVIDDTIICSKIGGERPRSTTKYKEWKQDVLAVNQGKMELSNDFYFDLLAMRDTIHSIAEYRGIINFVQKEVIVHDEIAIDPHPNLPIKRKAKYDGLNPGNLVLDLKTTKDPINDFKKNIYYHDIDRQMAWYCDIAKTQHAVILAIEKQKPYSTGLFVLSPETIQTGRDKYMSLLKTYKTQFLMGGIKDFNQHYMKMIV